MTAEQKQQIDNMDYYNLLKLWRHAGIGNELFQGECGQYYSKVMDEKKQALAPGEHVAISKAIGWS